jgi:hypothetical protein
MVKRVRKPSKDFFISYTASDRKWAEWIAGVLEANKYTTVIQAWDFGVGSNFIDRMNKALETCRRTVLVYSPDYFKSVYAQAEWQAAFTIDPTGEKGTLLPIRVRSCEPPKLLRPIVYIDLVDVAEAEARNRIILGAKRPAASRRAGFPGLRERAERTVFDVARDLQDVLNTTRITFNAQCEARDKLYATLRKRLRAKEDLEYEDFFHKYFARMNGVELRQHAIIRAYTKDVLRDYNERALKLSDEIQRVRGDYVDLDEEMPHLWELQEHLALWLRKYKVAIRMPSTCLVYLGVHEEMGFPSEVDDEIADLVESKRRRGLRVIHRRRERGGEGREG